MSGHEARVVRGMTTKLEKEEIESEVTSRPIAAPLSMNRIPGSQRGGMKARTEMRMDGIFT